MLRLAEMLTARKANRQNFCTPVVAKSQHRALWLMELFIHSLLYIVLMPGQDPSEWNPHLFNRSPPTKALPSSALTDGPALCRRTYVSTASRRGESSYGSYRVGVWARSPEETHWAPAARRA